MNENKRICTVTIIVPDRHESAPRVNVLLSEYGDYIISRLGLPLKGYPFSVICIVLEGTTDIIGALTGKLGQIEDIKVKSITV